MLSAQSRMGIKMNRIREGILNEYGLEENAEEDDDEVMAEQLL